MHGQDDCCFPLVIVHGGDGPSRRSVTIGDRCDEMPDKPGRAAAICIGRREQPIIKSMQHTSDPEDNFRSACLCVHGQAADIRDSRITLCGQNVIQNLLAVLVPVMNARCTCRFTAIDEHPLFQQSLIALVGNCVGPTVYIDVANVPRQLSTASHALSGVIAVHPAAKSCGARHEEQMPA